MFSHHQTSTVEFARSVEWHKQFLLSFHSHLIWSCIETWNVNKYSDNNICCVRTCKGGNCRCKIYFGLLSRLMINASNNYLYSLKSTLRIVFQKIDIYLKLFFATNQPGLSHPLPTKQWVQSITCTLFIKSTTCISQATHSQKQRCKLYIQCHL